MGSTYQSLDAMGTDRNPETEQERKSRYCKNDIVSLALLTTGLSNTMASKHTGNLTLSYVGCYTGFGFVLALILYYGLMKPFLVMYDEYDSDRRTRNIL